MSKFWIVVTLLLLIGIGLNFLPQENGINFTDLETECRYDRNTDYDISLQNRRLSFSGHYPVENPEARMSYDYRQTDNRVVLNVKNSDTPPVRQFYNNCVATGVYEAETDRLDTGRYTVILRHDGEEVEKRIIRVK